MRLFILVFCIVGGMSDVVKVRPGLLFINQSAMAFSSKSHTLVIEYDADKVISNLGLVESNLARAESLVTQSGTPLAGYFLQETKEVGKIVRNTRAYLEDFLQKHRQSFATRIKRSSFNPLGWLLENLLGVATTDEVRTLQELVGSQGRSTANYINKLVSHISVADKDIMRLSNSVHKSRAALMAIDKKLGNLDAVVRNITEDIVLSQAINYFGFCSNEISLETERLVSALQSTLLSGKISSLFLRPRTLLGFLQKLQQRVDLLWPVTDEHLTKYFDVMRVQVKVVVNRIFFLVDVPLRDSQGNYQLYEAKKFWSPIANSTSWARRIVTEHNFLAVSPDDKQFLLFEDLRGCLDARGLLVCREGRPVWSSDTNSCLIDLYLDRNVASDSCTHEINLKFNADFLQLRDMWLASTSSPLKMKKVCKEGSSEIIVSKGVSLIKNNGTDCEVYGNNVKLISHFVEGQSKIILEVPEVLEFQFPNLTKELREGGSLDLPDFRIVPLGHLEFFKSQIQLEKKSEETQWWIVILSFIIMGFALVYVSYMIFRFRKVILSPLYTRRRIGTPSRMSVTFANRKTETEKDEVERIVISPRPDSSRVKRWTSSLVRGFRPVTMSDIPIPIPTHAPPAPPSSPCMVRNIVPKPARVDTPRPRAVGDYEYLEMIG